LPRLVPYFSYPQLEHTIARPRDSRLPVFVGETVLTIAQVDDVGVGERIARAGVDYGDEEGRRLSGIRPFASCEGKSQSEDYSDSHGAPLARIIV
jgi:hypothetical protein